MSSNSREGLLQWMANPQTDVMWGWDCIVAMARHEANRLLMHEYIARFDSGTYLPVISGEVQDADGLKQVIQDFVLDWPRLSFAHGGLIDSKASLTMAVLGGLQLTMNKHLDTWHAVTISEIDPLQGPCLFLDLDLDEVPGTVGEDARVMLDLRHSDNFRLSFNLDENEPDKGGEFFQVLFKALPDEQRILLLGMIEPNAGSLSPQSFKLRTQRVAEPTAADPGDGAILIFMRMQGSEEGGIPGNAYRFLIADDPKPGDSATVLLSEQRTQGLPADYLLDSCAMLIASDDFDKQYDASGQLTQAQARSGALHFDARTDTLLPFVYEGKFLLVTLESSSLSFPAGGQNPLTIRTLDEGRIAVEWHTEAIRSTTFRFTEAVGDEQVAPDFMIEQRYVLELSAVYGHVEEHGQDVFKPLTWTLDIAHQDVNAAEQMKSGANPGWTLVVVYVVAQLVILSQQMIDPYIRSVLYRDFRFTTPMRAFLSNSLRLVTGKTIEIDDYHLPRDTAAFGHVAARFSGFAVEPAEVIIGAGASQSFRVTPAIEPLQWSIAGLNTASNDLGSIDANGLYHAPAAQTLDSRWLRLRVTATEPASGQQHSALVTVVREVLTVNPLIQQCAKGEQLTLYAGRLGDGLLEWSILDPVDGQSGSLIPDEQGLRCTYKATEQQVPGSACVLERVQVRDSLSGASRVAWVLVMLAPPSLSIALLADAALPPGQVRLQARLESYLPEGVQWHLALDGPGSIDNDGLYTSDPAALQRFVLVQARLEAMGMVFEGHLTLPLPLQQFPDQLAAMIRH